MPRRLAHALQSTPPARVVLLDCVTLWVSNVLLASENASADTMMRELTDLLDWYRTASCELIAVSNEVGMGLVPDNRLGREYRDLLGEVNKRLAKAADRVFWVVAGLPVEVKSQVVRLEDL